ncbi:MAG: hypothetical protein A3E87_03630 [Gammaproteobacteria bacterium RIFCSPHIGHO2_12_FULL_35_23]|nr:MAG: hypothetical protein A3E87_03630 [Gammaproteobacteria bacterium RIFCSPHIGHO2_12_FULL_35_23]
MNQSKIYVGNLTYGTTQNELETVFKQFGTVAEVKLIIDRVTERSKGFAFVTFEQAQSAQNALSLHGTDLNGRTIKVSLAKEDGGNRRSGGGNNGGGRFRNDRHGDRNDRRWE